MPLIYDECRRIAARQLQHERAGHTLNPTVLVHELYLRLVDQRRANWQNRAQFFHLRLLMRPAREYNAPEATESNRGVLKLYSNLCTLHSRDHRFRAPSTGFSIL